MLFRSLQQNSFENSYENSDNKHYWCPSGKHFGYFTDKDDNIIYIGLYLKEEGHFTWIFSSKKIMFRIIKGHDVSESKITIPWFEPNFNDIDALKDKIKIYIMFS